MKTTHNTPLAQYTTFQLGGPAKTIIHCAEPDELIQTVQQLTHNQEPFILIGGGSNIVPADQGVNITIIRYVSGHPLIHCDHQTVTVSASTNFDALCLYCVDQGLTGLNTCHGIPGTVGGAIVGNAGAFGKQIGDVLHSVRLLDHNGRLYTAQADDLGFSYRHSNLKESHHIVVDAVFQLTSSNPKDLAQQRAQILKQRWEKHPNLSTHPCAGSFFRNIEPTSKAERRQAAGYFLEQAGGKTLQSGGARIFDKHANIIVKGPDCCAQDVHDLHIKMKNLVKQQFDLDLIREVRFLGELDSHEKTNPIGFW